MTTPEKSSSQEYETLEQRVTALEESHINLSRDLVANTTALANNTQLTTAVLNDTSALVEFTNALRGFATFCRWVGRLLRWLGVYISPILIAAVAVWALIKGNRPP